MRERDLPGADDPRLEQAVAAVQEKVSTLAEVPRLVGFAFGPIEIDQAAWDKVMGKDGAPAALPRAREALADGGAVRRAARRAGAARRGRAAGREARARCFSRCASRSPAARVSAGIFESLALLGPEESLARVDAALARL